MRALYAAVAVLTHASLWAAAPAVGQEFHSRGIWSHTGHRIEISIDGSVVLTPLRDEVIRIAPGGRLTLREECPGRASRAIELTSDPSGAIQRRYSVDGQQTSPDAAAEQWLRTLLPAVTRQPSGEGAEVHLGEVDAAAGGLGSC